MPNSGHNGLSVRVRCVGNYLPEASAILARSTRPADAVEDRIHISSTNRSASVISTRDNAYDPPSPTVHELRTRNSRTPGTDRPAGLRTLP